MSETPSPRGPWSSRKFLGMMFAMATNKLLLGTGLLVLKDNVDAGSLAMWWWMITLTITDGFLSVGGILGIAYVDRYVGVAKMMTEGVPGSQLPSTGEGTPPQS
jgi:hypothetical protein